MSLLMEPSSHISLRLIDRSFADPAALDCPDCDVDLTLHQPDIEEPGRLLGICPDCHAWCVIELGTDYVEW